LVSLITTLASLITPLVSLITPLVSLITPLWYRWLPAFGIFDYPCGIFKLFCVVHHW
jgi:hypothetical protein